MSRPKSKIPARLVRPETKTQSIVVYAEGNNEYHYLKECVPFEFDKGTELSSNAVSAILQKIEDNINNDAIDQIYWIVDGGDEHNNQSKEFKKFYIEWRGHKKQGTPNWSKLKILINHPCLEYWFLLHKCDPPCGQDGKFTFFAYRNGKRKFFSPCDNLQGSDFYKKAFPNRKKGIKDKEFINEIANDETARAQAIKRAKCLEDKKPTSITQKTVLSYPCAQIYELFDEENKFFFSSACHQIEK